jgi:putative ABC transport system substrate-binding protein
VTLRRMRSRQFGMHVLIALAFVCLSALACENSGEGTQSRVYTIGVVETASSLDPVLDGFKGGMAELGHTEGNSVVYAYANPTGPRVDEIQPHVQELMQENLDLILSLGTPATLAVKQATAGTDVAVVFWSNDPVAAGIVPDLRRPGGNMTGIRGEPADGRRLEWLLQAAPHVRRIFVPYNPDDPDPVNTLGAMRDAASKLGVELVLQEARDDGEVVAAIATIPGDVDAVFLLPDAVVTSRMADWVAACLGRGLPLSGPSRDNVDTGALITYGADYYEGGKQAARLADQILKGEHKAGELPVETSPLGFDINLKTANSLGLDILEEMLRQVDRIVR